MIQLNKAYITLDQAAVVGLSTNIIYRTTVYLIYIIYIELSITHTATLNDFNILFRFEFQTLRRQVTECSESAESITAISLQQYRSIEPLLILN